MADEFGTDLAVIGKKKLDYHGENIVMGRFDFGADHIMPGMLYGAILGSPYAHAKVVSIDTSEAEALEGVKAVITYMDNPRWSDTILQWGQEVAAVAAIDEDTAFRALDLIHVEYETRPAVIDPEEAMQPGAPLVGTFPDGNTTPTPDILVRGDVEQGFADADITFEDTVGWTAYFAHNYISPDSVVVYWEGDDVYCWGENQNPFGQLAGITAGLRIPRHRIHHFVHGTGGGFGGKGGSYAEVAAALLSKKCGRPVKIVQPRYLTNVIMTHQYGVKAWFKIGAKNDGTLTAVDCKFWSDGGRNGGRSGFDDCPQYSWKCPNFRSETIGVATNKGSTGPWRCVQHPPSQFLSDVVLEKLAARLNMNPLELRRKVFVTADMPDQDNGRPLASNGLRECLEAAATAIRYEEKYHAPGARTLPDGRLHGIGIHAHVDGHGSISGARGGIINMTEDGKVLFNVGTSRVHQGYSAMAHIIAETIGVSYEDVHVGDWGSTDTCSEGGMQAGSTSTISTGAAMKVAAEDVRAQLFDQAAKDLGVSPEELDARDGKIFVKADQTKSVTHAQVMAKLQQPVIGRGVRWDAVLRKPVGNFPVGTPCNVRGVCASAAEVAVDPETGEVEILNFHNAIDVGRVISGVSAEAQVMSGLQIQINQALFYDQVYDKQTGAPLSFDHLDHKVASHLDVPQDKNSISIVETIDACGPYGCKGIGEPSISSYACITNAIYNATGKWISSTPWTPMKILQALGKV